MSDSDALPADAGVGRVVLRVNDLDRLTGFYERVVGLTVQDREMQGRSGDRAVLGAGEETLLELRRDRDAPERAPDETGLFHVAFRVPDRAALADALGRVERRWRLAGASDHRVSEALYLRDPEDNGVEIYRDRARADWPTAADGAVEMVTLPLDLDDLAGASDGADSDGTGRAPPDTTVGHVHLEVSSLSAARAFYADALGLRVRQTYGDDALFLAAGDYHHHVGLNTWNGRTEPPRGRGLAWFELVVPGRDVLAAARARFHDASVESEPTGDGVAVADPDGIRLRLRVADQT